MTFSVVARDPESGRLGVAVASCVFAVGTRVAHARPGVGVVATQGAAEITWGPAALDLLAAGEPTDRLVERYAGADVQIAVLDARGHVAIRSGAGCEPQTSHATGEQVSAQANLCVSPESAAAAVAAYTTEVGLPFEERLIRGLGAVEALGGDLRGRQSAALLVVGPEAWQQRTGGPEDLTVDLRVDDAANPVVELRRLLTVKRAHDALICSAVAPTPQQRHHYALHALELAPTDTAVLVAAGVALLDVGQFDDGLALLHRAREQAPHLGRRLRWLAHLGRLPLHTAIRAEQALQTSGSASPSET